MQSELDGTRWGLDLPTCERLYRQDKGGRGPAASDRFGVIKLARGRVERGRARDERSGRSRRWPRHRTVRHGDRPLQRARSGAGRAHYSRSASMLEASPTPDSAGDHGGLVSPPCGSGVAEATIKSSDARPCCRWQSTGLPARGNSCGSYGQRPPIFGIRSAGDASREEDVNRGRTDVECVRADRSSPTMSGRRRSSTQPR